MNKAKGSNSQSQSLLHLSFLHGVVLSASLISSPGFAEDLLSEDEFEFEAESSFEESSWRQDTRFTVQQLYSQGDRVGLLRTEGRVEYESAPWDGTYVKLSNKYSYFWSEDQLAQQAGSDYGNNKLEELWFQLSHQACFVKAGRQNLFWGNVEGTFAVDIVSPFDYTEPLLTDFSNIRMAADLVMSECYLGKSQWQVFLQPRARLSQFRHRNDSALEDLEDSLNEEFGFQYKHSWEALDVLLMVARLYGNTPVQIVDLSQPQGIRLDVPRFDLYGLSVVWAKGRLLLELDAGYKQDQLVLLSGEKDDRWELAIGAEYTTASNHNLNIGLWSFDQDSLDASVETDRVISTTAGWSKTYLNDDLTASLLGNWIEETGQSGLTVQGQYKWDDYWTYSVASGYSDLGELGSTQLGADEGWLITLMAKVQF